LIALFGRAADIPLLYSLHQGWASMKPNTAAGFVAAGMALYLSSLDRRDRFRRAGAACAAFAALIGLLTLVEYAFAVDLGIGQILFAVSGGSHAARMSPASASCLVIYGAALLLGTSARLRLRLVSENLSILVLLAAYVAILGYAYDVSVLYAVGPYNSVALPTAILFVVLATGLELADAERGLMRVLTSPYAGGVAARRLLPLALLAPTAIGWLRLEGQHLGWYDTEFGVALMVVANATIFAAVILGTAGPLDNADQARRQEEALRKSEERYRLIADNVTDVIVQLDLDGIRRYVSPSARRALGYAPEELVGQPIFAILNPEHEARMRQVLEAMRAGMDYATLSIKIRHKDGGERWVEAQLHLVRDAITDEPRDIVVTLRDVSSRKALEEQLSREKERAEAANRAKSEFLSRMSHELRTPMNGVIGFANILLGGALDPQQRRHVVMLKEAGHALLAIINDILDVAKIEAGKLELFSKPLNPAVIAERCLALVQPQAAAKGITLTCDRAPDLPAWVAGDASRLQQILLNLVGNAAKFTERGGVTVTVRRAPGGTGIRFAVTDTGPGISADSQQLLFKEFSQVGQGAEHRYGGTGLGLAISKRLTEAMGGSIGVESTPGVGSTFWFVVDLPPTAAPAVVEPEPEIRSATRPARILVAEDVPMNQIVVGTLLRGAGHDVTFANNGAEAVRAIQDADYDLVLMDMEMPEMDGIEATRAIRALDQRGRDVPIIALSANAMSEEVERCLVAGMNGHLAKPVAPEELERTVARWMASTPAPARARKHEGVFEGATVDALEKRLGRDRFASLVRMFRDQLDDAMRVMATSDHAAIAHEAHAMVSSAGNLGMTELKNSSLALMTAIKKKHAAEVPALVARMEAAAARAYAAIDARQAAAIA
jgi:PAS domain S-box-containing protein